MPELTRQIIFDRAARKMRSDFEELSSIPHSALKGSEAEKIIRTFLNSHLHKRFQAGAGFIIDPGNSVSKQTDVVIYDALNCPIYRASDEAAIYPSTNVAAVVEAKSVLDGEQLKSAYLNIAATKGLAKYRPPANLPYLVQAQTLGCLFAFSSPLTMSKIASHYEQCIRDYGIGRHIDLIVVLDRGVITLVAQMAGTPTWSPTFIEEIPETSAAEGMHIGIGVHEAGKDCLDVFLRFLLAHLSYFHNRVDHPGFDWQKTGSRGQVAVTYLTSVTAERDPVQKKQRLERYKSQVEQDFATHPPVPDQNA